MEKEIRTPPCRRKKLSAKRKKKEPRDPGNEKKISTSTGWTDHHWRERGEARWTTEDTSPLNGRHEIGLAWGLQLTAKAANKEPK